jgi:hypothetical protein
MSRLRAWDCGEWSLCCATRIACTSGVYGHTCFHPSFDGPLDVQPPRARIEVMYTILEPCPRVQTYLVYLCLELLNKITNILKHVECHVLLELCLVSSSI